MKYVALIMLIMSLNACGIALGALAGGVGGTISGEATSDKK